MQVVATPEPAGQKDLQDNKPKIKITKIDKHAGTNTIYIYIKMLHIPNRACACGRGDASSRAIVTWQIIRGTHEENFNFGKQDDDDAFNV